MNGPMQLGNVTSVSEDSPTTLICGLMKTAGGGQGGERETHTLHLTPGFSPLMRKGLQRDPQNSKHHYEHAGIRAMQYSAATVMEA